MIDWLTQCRSRTNLIPNDSVAKSSITDDFSLSVLFAVDQRAAEGEARPAAEIVSRPGAGAAILPSAIEFATKTGKDARKAGPD